MNQTQFAKVLGASRGYISDVENGSAKISADLLFEIADQFSGATKKASLLWLMTGSYDPVPWGDTPATSPLNAVLGLDSRALIAALRAVDALERAEKAPYTPEAKARLLRHALYIYLSELERTTQRGVEIGEARRVAEAACEAMVASLDATAADLSP